MKQPIFQRTKLINELQNILLYPLTVVVAGMGYGKTMTSRSFLEDYDLNYAWLSIGHNEMSLNTLWDYLVFQLEDIAPHLSSIFSQYGFPTDASQREKLIHLIRKYPYKKHTVLVFDDYHHASIPELDLLVEQIVWAKMDNFHILLLSRRMPEFHMDELLLKDYCYLIDQQCFEMDSEEIESYFSLHKTSLSPEELKMVFRLTEGWISAVYLMLKHYHTTRQIQPGINLFRLIENSILSHCTPEEIELLHLCSLFDTMTPDQLVFISKNHNAEALLKKISQHLVFVQYHEKEEFYRIHKLFATYLQKKWKEANDEKALQETYIRCGCWYLNQGNTITGLKYLLKGEAYDLILTQFSESSIGAILHSNNDFIQKLFQEIPIKKRYEYPLAYLTYIGFCITNINPQEGVRLLTEAKKHFLNKTGMDSLLEKQVQGEILLIDSYTKFNDIYAMSEKIQEAHQWIPSGSVIANRNKIITLGCPISLYLYHRYPRQLFSTMNQAKTAFLTYSKLAHGCGIGLDDLLFAEYLAETGDQKKATVIADKAFRKASSECQKDVMFNASFTRIRALHALGHYDQTAGLFREMQQIAEESSNPIYLSTYELCAAYISYQSCQPNFLPEWIQDNHLKNSSMSYEGASFYYIIHGKYLLAKNDYLALEINAEVLLDSCKVFQFVLGYIHAYLMQAIAKKYLYGHESSSKSFNQCLTLASKDNIFLSLSEYHQELISLLEYHLALGTIDPDLSGFAKALLAKTLQYGAFSEGIPSCPEPPEKLTSRELEILNQISQGKTNKAIAESLYLAEVTVRKHITSIYKKLKVSGRPAAVRKATELNLF